MTLTVGSLCTGTGQLERALTLAGLDVELAFVADPDPAASTVLAHHHPDVPNLGDITTVDWTTIAPVDILTAGYPCQPLSLAGRRAGLTDDRWIWNDVYAAIRDLRPRVVLLENVPGHLSLGFGRVLGDLAAIGFDARWTCVRASDVGAAHRRERVFIVAWPTTDATGQRHGHAGPPLLAGISAAAVGGGAGPGGVSLLPTPAATRSGRQQSASDGAAIRPSLDMVTALLPTPRTSDATGSGPHGDGGPEIRTAVTDLLPTPDATHGRKTTRTGPLLAGAVELLPTPRASDGVKGGPNRRGSSGDLMLPAAVQPGRWGRYAAAIQRWEQVTGIPAPEPTEAGKNGPRLSARFVEWLQGVPAGYVTDLVKRNDALRLLGNGVVALQGAHALRLLAGAR